MSGDEFERIRPEIRALVVRGNITPAELLEIRCNSWEWEALVPAMNDEAFCERMQYTLDNCFTRRERPFTTYNQALEGLWAPELLKRFKNRALEASAAFDFMTAIDSCAVTECPLRLDKKRCSLANGERVNVIGWGPGRLTQKEAKASIGAREPFVSIGFDDGGVFSVSMELVRVHSDGSCQACSIEAEIGTEEEPHPVPSRFHTCPPTYQNAEYGVHVFSGPEGFKPLYERNPDGNINNCALANGDERKNCQVCKEQCPDRGRFK